MLASFKSIIRISRRRWVLAATVGVGVVMFVAVAFFGRGDPETQRIAQGPHARGQGVSSKTVNKTADRQDTDNKPSVDSTSGPKSKVRDKRATGGGKTSSTTPRGAGVPTGASPQSDSPNDTSVVDELREDVVDEITDQLDGKVDGVDLDSVADDVLDQMEQGLDLEEAVDKVVGLLRPPPLPVETAAPFGELGGTLPRL